MIHVLVLLFVHFCWSHEGLNSSPPSTPEFIESKNLEIYYPEQPVTNLPPKTELTFSRELNIVIQPRAQRTRLYGVIPPCEIVSETVNQNLLRVSIPKIVSSIAVTPYDENRICLSTLVPIPESLDADTFNGACKLQGHAIVDMTPKCYQAVQDHDSGNDLFTTKVTNTGENPRLYAIPNLADRMKVACKASTETITVDFEGDLKMICYNSWGSSKISEFVKAIESNFNIKVRVPVPANLQDVELQEQQTAPPISL